ncbi:MAG TPA: helix-turn-helix domain-containing protein, partial [Ktedonobacterales bacterium]
MSTPDRADAKRQQIRAGAQRLFLKLGYERASMDAIAAEARVSKQTLYRYYQAKGALFVDILRQMTVGSFLRDVPALVEGLPLTSQADLEGALVAFTTGASESLLAPAYVAMLRVLIAEAPRFPELAE